MIFAPGQEFRALVSGVRKDGKPWNKVRWEDENGGAFEAYVNPEVAQQFFALKKGDVIDLRGHFYTSQGNYGPVLHVGIDGFDYPKPAVK